MSRPYPFNESDGLELDPTYRELLRDEPVSRVVLPHGGEAWLVVRHADVRTVLGDPRFSRAAVVGRDMPRVRPEIERNRHAIMNLDPPMHTRARRLLAGVLTAQRVEALRPRAAELTTQLLVDLRAAGPGADLVQHVSVPFSVTIICELLGVPVAYRPVFRRASEVLMSASVMTPPERLMARDELTVYMAAMVAERWINPADDLLGVLACTQLDGDRPSKTELIDLGVAVFVGGHEATMNQIGNMIYALLARPERWAALRRDEAVTRAVEELLRYTPMLASAGYPRVAMEDVELSGVTVRAGETVVVSLNAANRDLEVFDEPEMLVLDRSVSRHLGFGHGPHQCPAPELARMALHEVLAGLVRDFPDLSLAVAPEDVRWREGALIRGPQALPLTWG